MDEYQVEALLRKERYFRDTKQWNKWRASYDPDASKTHINISWFKGDIDAWVEGSKGMAARGVSPQHVVTPNEIIVNGANALAISTCLVMTRFEMEGADFDINALFRIVARAVKIDNDWKLRTLNCIYVQDSIQPAIPRVGDHVNFDLSIVADARKSYRALCWSIARKGGKPNLDMMGEDNLQEAEDFMKQMYSWIENPAW